MTNDHDAIGVTRTNSDGLAAVCRCGWASTVVPAERGPGGGLLWDQTGPERAALAQHAAHVRRVKARA